METKIQEVQQYFINEINRNEFTISDITYNSIRIKIKGGFEFSLHVPMSTGINIESLSTLSFMEINFNKEQTKEFLVIFKQCQETILKDKEQAEYDRLKVKFG